MVASSPPLIGLVPAGQPLITAPTSQPTPTSFLYAIPRAAGAAKPFAHLAVFLLPGAALPAGAAAAIYAAANSGALLRGDPVEPAFRFLGGVGPGKESAIFRLSGGGGGSAGSAGNGGGQARNGDGAVVNGGGGGGAWDSNNNNNNNNNNGGGVGEEEGVVIGVSVEPAASVAERIQELQQQQQQQQQQKQNGGRSPGPPSTQVLAQRIIQNAYNFLSSFSGQVGEAGVEVVPLRAFQEWWAKFEGRVQRDPTFLEREQD